MFGGSTIEVHPKWRWSWRFLVPLRLFGCAVASCACYVMLSFFGRDSLGSENVQLKVAETMSRARLRTSIIT